MPRNGSGQYSLPPVYLATPGTTIRAEQHNTPLEDIAQSLTNSLPRDGTAPMTGNLPMAGRKIINLGAPTGASDAVRLQDVEVQATTTVSGRVELATNAETVTGTDATRAVTPAGLAAALAPKVNMYVPTGAVMAFAMDSSPNGWLFCNGQAVSRSTYDDLWDAIGITYGNGNGSTTFNLPDLRGSFIRGHNSGGSIDPGRVFGSYQTPSDARLAEFQVQANPAGGLLYGTSNVPVNGDWSSYRISGSYAAEEGAFIRFRNNGVTDTRPDNVALRYCIKT